MKLLGLIFIILPFLSITFGFYLSLKRNKLSNILSWIFFLGGINISIIFIIFNIIFVNISSSQIAKYEILVSQNYNNKKAIREWNDKYSYHRFLYDKTPINIFLLKKYINLNYIYYELDHKKTIDKTRDF